MLNKDERVLLEALTSFLNQDAKLGLKSHKPAEETEHSVQFLHEQIDEMFNLKAADLVHCDGVCSAFSKVHSYKYLTDPEFCESLKKELSAQGVPGTEINEACEFVSKILDELIKEEGEGWREQDAGFHPNLDEIIKVSQPEQYGK